MNSEYDYGKIVTAYKSPWACLHNALSWLLTVSYMPGYRFNIVSVAKPRYLCLKSLDLAAIWQLSTAALFITIASQWARWRLKSPASRLFTHAFIQAQIKENIKAQCPWPLWWKFTRDWRIPRTKSQWRGKCFRHNMLRRLSEFKRVFQLHWSNKYEQPWWILANMNSTRIVTNAISYTSYCTLDSFMHITHSIWLLTDGI